MTTRSYNQFCALAYALDIIGERWTMLIIRELLNGPRRFTDLVEGLPGISTNLLTERLKSLEEQGIIGRRTLPPPAASTVYELTPLGHALETPLLELGKWGSQFLPGTLGENALPSPGAMALALKAFFHPGVAGNADETYQLYLDNECLHVQVADGQIQVQQGEAHKPDAVFHTDMRVFLGLFAGHIPPDEAISADLIQIEGDPAALTRFLSLSGLSVTR